MRQILYFPSVTKGKIFLLLGMILVGTVVEGFGVAMLFPIVEFVEKGRDFASLANSSKMWLYLGRVFDLFRIPKTLLALMSVVFALLLIRQIFNYLKMLYRNWISEGICADIRSEGFRWFIQADVSFYDSHSVGQIINALSVDGTRAGGAVFSAFNLAGACIVFAVYFTLLLMLSPGMTFLAMAIMAALGLSLRSRFRKSEKIGVEMSRNNEEISTALIERLSGMRLVRLCTTEEAEAAFVKGLSESIRKNAFRLAKVRARAEFVIDPMVVLAGLIILYLSVEVFAMGLAKTGVFIFVLLRLMPFVKEVFDLRQTVASQAGSLTRVIDLFSDARRSRKIEGGSLRELKIQKGIRFEDVCFSYESGGSPVLKNVSVFIPAGKLTALVGRSGAGKSTLVDLIPRLRVPQRGSILLDDLPIQDYDLVALRKSIAFVSQGEFLFNETVENNIRYSRPDAEMSEIARSAEMAYADHFIRTLPKGYQTFVGERGVRLSGGERQRLALARALLKKASIIIMDEPTSSLDSESERLVQRALAEVRDRGVITMIVIAHRLSTIKDADQIIVLEKGSVIEWGSHRDLMHEDAWYAEMVKMQAAI